MIGEPVCRGHMSEKHDGLDPRVYVDPIFRRAVVLCRGCYAAAERLGLSLIPERRTEPERQGRFQWPSVG